MTRHPPMATKGREPDPLTIITFASCSRAIIGNCPGRPARRALRRARRLHHGAVQA